MRLRALVAAPVLFIVVFVAFVGFAPAAFADVDPTYAALRAAKPAGPALSVENLTLQRDAFRFRFQKGVFQFVTPVEGRATGAVFVGEGTWELTPTNAGESRNLASRTGRAGFEVLADRFDGLALLFTDGTEAEIRRAGKEGATAPAGAAGIWDAVRRSERGDLKTNLEIRILQDLLRPAAPDSGVFMAVVDGRDLPAGLVLVDPVGLDWFSAGAALGFENSALWIIPEADRGFWYSAMRRGGPPSPPAAYAEHYAIDSAISENTRLAGTTVVTVRFADSGARVLPIQLFDRLRLRDAATAPPDSDAWSPAAYIQEKEDEDSDAAVVLPAAPDAGTSLRLRLRYEGKDVLHSRGEGTFAVEARQSWYPNLGTFREPATFDLTYRIPKGKQVVSVGERVSEKTEGGVNVSVWRAARPIRVAGFNYGKFRRLDADDKESGMRIEVYTNPTTPDIVEEVNAMLANRSFMAGERSEASPNTYAGLHQLHVDSATFAQGAMADALNAARVFTAYFGPIPEKRVSITQQEQWFFGQSWPSLVFLPYMAALDGTQRHELGLGGASSNDFVDLVGAHELAHQWWGHCVDGQSYRDTWLSEGFAEFSASLVMQRTMPAARLADYWERNRKRILDRPPGSAVSNDQAGPITLGTRLLSRHSPSAYAAIVYAKGAYVLQMLRMLMWDPHGKPPDGAFMAMMQDYLKTYSGRDASTADFQAVVQKHLTPTMDAAKNGRIDWFFRQWVDGTEIPRYTSTVQVKPAADGQYQLSGAVTQDGVSKDFIGYLPLYVEYDKGETQRLAMVTFVGNMSTPVEGTIRLPKVPKRIVPNAQHDVLARD